MGDVKAPIDPHCAFCEMPLAPDVHVPHECKCATCGGVVPGWVLREDTPPTCEDCVLGISNLDDEDSLENMVRG